MMGGFFTYKYTIKTPKCPDLVCPTVNCPPNVNVQQLDLDKIKKIKGDFTYSPTFTGTIIFTDSCR
jgi:hypothetical protein